MIPTAALLAALAVAQQEAELAGAPWLDEEPPPAFSLELEGDALGGPLEWAPEEAEEEPAAAAEEASPPGRLVAAAWCAIRTGSPAAEEEDPLGCDLGLGASFWTWRVDGRGWLSLVVLVGAESFAAGVAWTVEVLERAVSIGLGVTVPHSGGGGVDFGELAPAIGATLGVGDWP